MQCCWPYLDFDVTVIAVGAADQAFVGRPPTGTVYAESDRERRLSEYVFLSRPVPWWYCVIGYCVFVIVGCVVSVPACSGAPMVMKLLAEVA